MATYTVPNFSVFGRSNKDQRPEQPAPRFPVLKSSMSGIVPYFSQAYGDWQQKGLSESGPDTGESKVMKLRVREQLSWGSQNHIAKIWCVVDWALKTKKNSWSSNKVDVFWHRCIHASAMLITSRLCQ